MPPFHPKAVANTILKKLSEQKLQANSVKLQKLLYFAHGWHLAITGFKLIDEDVEAYSFGVVIPAIYHGCKEFGNNPINTNLSEYDTEHSKWEEPFVPDSEFIDSLLDKIIETYGILSTTQLSNLSHQEDTPWQITASEHDFNIQPHLSIDDDVIRDYFRECGNMSRPEHKRNLLNIKVEDINIPEQPAEQADDITTREFKEYVQSSYWSSFRSGDRKWKRIRDYAVLWSPSKQKGIIKLTLADAVEYKIVVKSVSELEMLANMFRFEKVVYYNISSGSIASGWTPVSREN